VAETFTERTRNYDISLRRQDWKSRRWKFRKGFHPSCSRSRFTHWSRKPRIERVVTRTFR
jgi:hypothetical protein